MFFIKAKSRSVNPGPVDDIAAGISKGQRSVERESGGVEEFRDGVRAGIGIADDIGPVVSQAGAAFVRAGEDGKWLAGLGGDECR